MTNDDDVRRRLVDRCLQCEPGRGPTMMRGKARVLIAGLLVLVVGCGSSGTDAQGGDGLTMALVGFSAAGIDQADFVSDTVVQVDVCQDACNSGQGDEINLEPFTPTLVSAVFVNRGKADIVLDRYTVNVLNSGVPSATRNISARLPGGRCLGLDPQKQCAVDPDCGVTAACVHSETQVGVLLYDLDFKERVLHGTCPSDVQNLTLDTELAFSGSDETGERRTVEASYVATFANFDNCDDQ